MDHRSEYAKITADFPSFVIRMEFGDYDTFVLLRINNSLESLRSRLEVDRVGYNLQSIS